LQLPPKDRNETRFQSRHDDCFCIDDRNEPKSFYSNPFQALANIIDDIKNDHDDCFLATQILQSKYAKSDVKTVAQHQTHLSQTQRNELHLLFQKHTKLFSGELGYYPQKKMHLKLLHNAKPVHSKPYPIPHNQQEVFKKELDHLVSLGILSRVGGTEWALPIFIAILKPTLFANAYISQ
jgi:hypothetical protein